MKLGMRVSGLKETRLKLRNIAERVPDAARGQMRRSAATIVEEAKLNTPEDDQLLVKSIRILRDYGTHGRLQIDIVAGGETAVNPDGRVINLDQYAWIIHENYEQYKPGPRTLRKMAANPGRIIGSQFLTRAAEKEEPKLEKQMISAIEGIVREYEG